MGGFFIALQSGAIFMYYVVLSGTIKKQMAKEAACYIEERVDYVDVESHGYNQRLHALQLKKNKRTQMLNKEARLCGEYSDIPADLETEYYLKEINKFKSINYCFELERKIEILQTVVLNHVEELKRMRGIDLSISGSPQQL
jgi:hypothetical protein